MGSTSSLNDKSSRCADKDRIARAGAPQLLDIAFVDVSRKAITLPEEKH
jgi:hypothetical protein